MIQIDADKLMNSSDELEIVRATKELLAFASESKRSKAIAALTYSFRCSLTDVIQHLLPNMTGTR